MPTGYTADVRSGKVTDFAEFVMRCARNFGALNSMRDEAMDAPIPEEFQPSTYEDMELRKAKAELAHLQSMSPAEAEAEAGLEYAHRTEEYRKALAGRAEDRKRYEAMLAKARMWHPPTPDHKALKEFMVQQLQESIKFDCDFFWAAPARQTGDEWHRSAVESTMKRIGDYAKYREEEVTRAESRTRWVRQLRESLR